MALRIPLSLGFSCAGPLNLSPPKNRIEPPHGCWVGTGCAQPRVQAQKPLRGQGGLWRPQGLGSWRAEEVIPVLNCRQGQAFPPTAGGEQPARFPSSPKRGDWAISRHKFQVFVGQRGNYRWKLPNDLAREKAEMKARIWRQIMLALNFFTGCPFSLCERAGEKGLPNLLVLGAEGFRHPGERASAVPPTWSQSKKPGGWFSGCSHGLLPVWLKFPASIHASWCVWCRCPFLVAACRATGLGGLFVSSSLKMDSDEWGFEHQEYLAWQQHWRIEKPPVLENAGNGLGKGLDETGRAAPEMVCALWGCKSRGTLHTIERGPRLEQNALTRSQDPGQGRGLEAQLFVLALNQWVASSAWLRGDCRPQYSGLKE